jgi:predicted transcriptional regulator
MSNYGNCFAAVQLLTKAPRTCSELAGLIGVGQAAVYRYLKEMEPWGLIRPTVPRPRTEGYIGAAETVWEWAP